LTLVGGGAASLHGHSSHEWLLPAWPGPAKHMRDLAHPYV
jgi:hypothetical protein